jgi:hypothetical protein
MEGGGGGARGSMPAVWHGFDLAEALDWTRVLRMHWPDWPGPAALWSISVGLQEGRPTALPDWVERARTAEAIGFTPALYDRMHRALDAIPAVEHAAHPDNAPDPRWPVHTIRAFDATMWSDWPWLVGSGWSDEEATRLLLSARELLEPHT